MILKQKLELQRANLQEILPFKLSGGGGTEASSTALKQLQEAAEKIKQEKEKLKKLFVGTGALNFATIHNQSYLERKHSAYEKGLLALQELQRQFNEEIQKIDNSSKSETDTLNENYTKLQSSITKWEEFKKVTSAIHRWRGDIQNSICVLSPSSTQGNCVFPKNL
ncbi:hypothetical protein [Candidatus Mycoplasma haematominutum]|uniref:hypothetical protein n=1 Tax=Candidatus Mycoplasma haematominutum TaxID=209446 RepID=UPI0011B7CF90|nr:hypothetical protein [Candidatus Mycoplasma haematominutum]